MDSEPVTVVVARRVKPGHEPAYEAWLERLIAGAAGMPGYLGTNVVRPASGGPPEYTSVFRFASLADLRAFEASDLRRRALAEVEADAIWRELTGLELWFTPPAGTVVPQPSRLRMALLLIVVVYLLVLSIGQLVGLVLADVGMPIRLLVTIVIEVFVMTYLLMPRLTRWLAKWIYPRVTSR
ncbi:antibiotic biosynthesis monooxygenase [Nannocystaceae bacterium ST9]